ncbi:MAG: PEP-utilizing enzyme [Candidatus Nanoarchaeia archaeon]|nr:PEP-utilizing enzyme [Candidatus Nanoarchaeia archaeon]
MDLINDIKEVDWICIVNRLESLLFRSITDRAYMNFKNLTGIPWNAESILRLGEGEVFHKKQEVEWLKVFFSKTNLAEINKFKNALVVNVKKLDKKAEEIKKIKCSELTQQQIIKKIEEFTNAALHSHCFLVPMPIADKAISNRISDSLPENLDKQKILGILTFPDKENQHVLEERSLYNLTKNYKNKNYQKLLDNHLKKFAIIGARGYKFDKAWTKEDIEERIKNLISQNKNPDAELKKLAESRKREKELFKQTIKELKIANDSELYKLIKLAKEFAYIRTWRTDTIYGAGYKVKDLFYEIAKKAGFPIKDLQNLTYTEVIGMAKTEKAPISEQELNKRREYSAQFTFKDSYNVLSGRKWQERLQFLREKVNSEINEIKGNVANKGNAQGQAKIVLIPEDLPKVKQKDILITVMTFPNFIPAMEKAAAFVTDEGGILCHAAIVSREMNKPCIIATKIATKIFKDGDLVEVDAKKGIVRKIYK